MVASLNRVYENLWTLQKTPLTVTKAHNRVHVTLLQCLAHNSVCPQFSICRGVCTARERERSQSAEAVLHPECSITQFYL
jgi:hypothetical protein